LVNIKMTLSLEDVRTSDANEGEKAAVLPLGVLSELDEGVSVKRGGRDERDVWLLK
jgi:hypothetical protein